MRDDLVAIAASINARLATLGAAQKNAEAAITAAERTSNYALAAAAIAVIGVLITALVTWRNGHLQVRVAQQLKHAEFRQTWINALREEMARFQLLTAQSLRDPNKDAELVQSMSMILLRMDRADKDYDRLVETMDGVVGAVVGDVAADVGGDVVECKSSTGDAGRGTAPTDLLLICQDILKREWDVTKAEMNRTPVIWPSERKALASTERERQERVAAVAKRRNGKPATVPLHLDRVWTSAVAPRRGKLTRAIRAVVRAATNTDGR